MPAIKERAAENKILSGCRGFAASCVSSSDKTGRREIIIYLATEFNEFVTRATRLPTANNVYKMSSGNDYRYGSIKLDSDRCVLKIGGRKNLATDYRQNYRPKLNVCFGE